MKNIHICRCRQCDREFIYREAERPPYPDNKTYVPRYCSSCRRKHREEINQKAELAAAEKRRADREASLSAFEEALAAHKTIPLNEIKPCPDNTLLVIGNGFDLMHGVKSGYYNFRDSLGKSSPLRQMLESNIDADDIWADFENNLAKIDYNSMVDPYVMDMWLDYFDAYSDDSAASYFAAIDASITPMNIIGSDLPRRFRQWVDTLSPGTKEKPLSSLIADCPVLCFNYTEFVETIYGVSPDNICYIHGCRKMNEELILGHLPSESLGLKENEAASRSLADKLPFINMANDHAAQMLADYDNDLTKSCDQIITKNKSFFNKLGHIENIVTIGHSLYPVDRDYFREIIRVHPEPSKINWYFGCHGLSDLTRIEDFIREFRINKNKVNIFRTDTIKVNLTQPKSIKSKPPKITNLCVSADGRWSVKRENGSFFIEDSNHKRVLDHEFSQPISYAFFNNAGQYIFAVKKRYPAGVFLYKLIDDQWRLLDELAPPENQSLINSRLKKVFLDDSCLTFVYNNRIRIYDANNGETVNSKRLKNAPAHEYSGEDLTPHFCSAG